MLTPTLLLFSLLLAAAAVITTTTTSSADDVSVDAGSNVTLSCGPHINNNVLWVWDGARDAASRFDHTAGGELVISDVRKEDERVYTCQDAESNESLHEIFVHVRTVPPAVVNLTVLPKSVFATVAWGVAGDGGANITGFRLFLRRDRSHLSPEQEREVQSQPEIRASYEWSEIDDIPANATSHAVYDLAPNSTYYFRICAMNLLGCGMNVSVQASTAFDAAEVQAAEDERRAKREEEEDEGVSVLKIWMVGIGVFVVTFALMGFGISLLLIRNCDRAKRRGSGETTEEEVMELVPHITLNPSFNIDMLEYHEPTAASRPIISNEDLIVDVVTDMQQRQQQRDGELIDTCEEDNELNSVNSPLKRQNKTLSESSNSINRPNG